jgi:hypothetical protein
MYFNLDLWFKILSIFVIDIFFAFSIAGMALHDLNGDVVFLPV